MIAYGRGGAGRASAPAGAEVLRRESGDPVPPGAFAAITRRFDPALPAVEALATIREDAAGDT